MSAQGLPSVLAFERYDPTDASLDWLRERGVNVIFGNALWEMPFKRFTEDELIAKAHGCVALMGASGTRITRRVIQALPDLRYISKYGIGVDSIDIDAVTDCSFSLDLHVSTSGNLSTSCAAAPSNGSRGAVPAALAAIAALGLVAARRRRQG